VIRKPKLIGYWRRTSETGSSGASIIAYNNITAFKFPDKMQVYLTCNIEVSGIQRYHFMHTELIYCILNDTLNNSVAQPQYNITARIIKILHASKLNICFQTFMEEVVQTAAFWVLRHCSSVGSEMHANSIFNTEKTESMVMLPSPRQNPGD
jgi:hypothetical protein